MHSRNFAPANQSALSTAKGIHSRMTSLGSIKQITAGVRNFRREFLSPRTLGGGFILMISLFIWSNAPLTANASNLTDSATFQTTGINGWVSAALTDLHIKFTGPDILKYQDCPSMTSGLALTISETANGKTSQIPLQWVKTTTEQILQDGLMCHFEIGLHYYDGALEQQNSQALIPQIGLASNAPSLISILLDGQVIGTGNATFRVPGPNDLQLLSPTRGTISGQTLDLKVDYSLAPDEVAPSDWFLFLHDTNGNPVNGFISKQVSEKEWYIFIPNSGIYTVWMQGDTTIQGCNGFPGLIGNAPPAYYCPSKVLQGNVGIQVDTKLASTVPNNRILNLTCNEVYIEKSSSCAITLNSRDVFGQSAEIGKTVAASVTVTTQSGVQSTRLITLIVGQNNNYVLDPGTTAETVTVSIPNSSATASAVANAHMYSLSDMYQIAWKIDCSQNRKQLVCNANSSAIPNPGFLLPTSLPYQVVLSSYDTAVGVISQTTLKTGTFTPNKQISLSIPYSNSISGVTFQVDDSDQGYTWTNSKYSEPLTPDKVILKLNCPSNFSGNSFTCTLTAKSNAQSTVIPKIILQYKTDTRSWTQFKVVPSPLNKSIKVTVPNMLGKSQDVRAVTNFGSTAVYSSTSSWVAAHPVTPVPTPTKSPNAINTGDKKACQVYYQAFAQGAALPFGSPKLGYVLRAGYQLAQQYAQDPTLKLDLQVMYDDSLYNRTDSSTGFEIDNICSKYGYP